MPSSGIEPANLRSLARRSNQLSYAATVKYQDFHLLRELIECIYDILYSQTQSAKQTVENAQMLLLGAKLYRLSNDSTVLDRVKKTWNVSNRVLLSLVPCEL